MALFLKAKAHFRMTHDKTINAISLAGACGYVGGLVSANLPFVIGLTLTMLTVFALVAYHPNTETIADNYTRELRNQ